MSQKFQTTHSVRSVLKKKKTVLDLDVECQHLGLLENFVQTVTSKYSSSTLSSTFANVADHCLSTCLVKVSMFIEGEYLGALHMRKYYAETR